MRGHLTESQPDLFGDNIHQKKRCTKCGRMKAWSAFSSNGVSKLTGRRKLTSACRYCTNRLQRKMSKDDDRRRVNRQSKLSRYPGMSIERYDEMLGEQGGACAICGSTVLPIDPRTKRPYELAVDHDHVTGKVRSLLCHFCNVGLGAFRDNPVLLQAAISYLEKHREKAC